MTATRITVSRTMSINFWINGQVGFWTISSVGIPSLDDVSSTTFQVAVLLRQRTTLSFLSDFPVIIASYFITNGISNTLKYNFVRV